MCCTIRNLAAALLVSILTIEAGADLLLRIPRDGCGKRVSVRNMDLDIASAADDFEFTRSGIISQISAFFYIRFTNPLPDDWEVEIRKEFRGEPSPVAWSWTTGGVAEWTGETWFELGVLYKVYKVTWEIAPERGGLHLEPGRYWVVPRGVGVGEPARGLVYWATARAGFTSFLWNAALFQNQSGWSVALCPTVFPIFPSDFAWEMEGSAGGIRDLREAILQEVSVQRGEGVASRNRWLRRIDDREYHFRSEVDASHQRSVLVATATYESEEPFPAEVIVRVAARKRGRDELPGTLFIRDWVLGRWKRIQRMSIRRREGFWQVNDLAPSRYISNAGVIQLKLIIASDDPVEFDVLMDMLRVDVLVSRGD